MDGDYWEAMIDKGQWREFGQDTGVTPLLFTMSAMGFLMTTESQDLGLTSHPKDGGYTWGTFYPCVHQTHLECLLLKSLI